MGISKEIFVKDKAIIQESIDRQIANYRNEELNMKRIKNPIYLSQMKIQSKKGMNNDASE